MNSAKLERSARLQRVDDALTRYGSLSTRDIISICNVCAVNSIIAELRDNGRRITCKKVGATEFRYTMEVKCNE